MTYSLLELQETLRNIPMEGVQSVAQGQHGQSAQLLGMDEIKRRVDMRKEAESQKQEEAKPPMVDQYLQASMSLQNPQMGQPMQPPMGQPPGPMMAPPPAPTAGPPMGGPPMAQGPVAPGIAGMYQGGPVRGYENGGEIDFWDEVGDIAYNWAVPQDPLSIALTAGTLTGVGAIPYGLNKVRKTWKSGRELLDLANRIKRSRTAAQRTTGRVADEIAEGAKGAVGKPRRPKGDLSLGQRLRGERLPHSSPSGGGPTVRRATTESGRRHASYGQLPRPGQTTGGGGGFRGERAFVQDLGKRVQKRIGKGVGAGVVGYGAAAALDPDYEFVTTDDPDEFVTTNDSDGIASIQVPGPFGVNDDVLQQSRDMDTDKANALLASFPHQPGRDGDGSVSDPESDQGYTGYFPPPGEFDPEDSRKQALWWALMTGGLNLAKEGQLADAGIGALEGFTEFMETERGYHDASEAQRIAYEDAISRRMRAEADLSSGGLNLYLQRQIAKDKNWIAKTDQDKQRSIDRWTKEYMELQAAGPIPGRAEVSATMDESAGIG